MHLLEASPIRLLLAGALIAALLIPAVIAGVAAANHSYFGHLTLTRPGGSPVPLPTAVIWLLFAAGGACSFAVIAAPAAVALRHRTIRLRNQVTLAALAASVVLSLLLMWLRLSGQPA